MPPPLAQFLEDPTFQRMRLVAPECPQTPTMQQCCGDAGIPEAAAAQPQRSRTVVAPYPSFFHPSSANELLSHRVRSCSHLRRTQQLGAYRSEANNVVLAILEARGRKCLSTVISALGIISR